MNGRRLDEFRGLPPTQAWRVDALCQRFEAEWRIGDELRIEDFLAEADQPQRVALFRELLALELELRQGRGERPDLREYRTRFPDHTAAIAAVFSSKSVADDGGGSTPTVVPVQPSLTAVPGTRIGPYKLLQQIGEGGMGVVYMAEQETPIRRQVALKIIKPGMDSDQMIARFEAERQALALMDHPGIARVLDAGTTDTDRHYFVMELVHGIPITDYCDRNQLSLPERLELFIRVCQAIQHAHQKGIIHRDIKPSNVLVTLNDGRPVPKVIDFGLAKAMEGRLTERTMFTQFGEVIGTLEYMSPEQAEMGALDIDTGSDIYSLGVVLYELLTGSTPLQRDTVRQAAYAEILRRIREEEAPRPSSRLGESAAALATIAALRQTEPARLAKLVRGELDWIVTKAVEKDRTRRYETAGGLARDVERFLSHEPVEAGPPSATYRLRKYARKHCAVLAMVGSFAVLLLLAAALNTRQAYLATKARNEALCANKQSRLNEAKAKDQEIQARRSAAEMRAVLGFLEGRVLAAARPEGRPGGLGNTVTLRQVIDAALPAVSQDFADQPLVEARLRQTLGTSYYHLGDPAKAAEQLEASRALYARHRGPDDPDTLKSMDNLASTYNAVGRPAEALKLHEHALALMKAKLGPDHLNTLQTMNNLATSYYSLGEHAQALKLQEETLTLRKAKLGPDHPDTLASMNNLAASYFSLGRHAEALKLYEETLALQRAKLGPDHPDTLVSMNNLAASYYSLGRHAEALKLQEETLTLRKAELGPDHPDTLASMQNVANSYLAVGRRAEALKLHEETLTLMKAKLGPDHPDTLMSVHNVANSYAALHRHNEAIKFYEEALTLRKVKLGPDHPETLTSMYYLANSYAALGRQDEALQLRRETFALRKTRLGPDHLDTIASMLQLAMNYSVLGRHAEALQLCEEALPLMKDKLGPDHRKTLITLSVLADSYAALGRHAEAIKLHEQTVAVQTAKLGPDHPDTLLSRLSMASSLVQAGRGAEAAADCRSAAETWEKVGASDAWNLYNAACFRAVTAAALCAADASPAGARQAEAEAARALAWLERAVAAGFRDAATMAQDHDLDALRHRADFKELLARLSAARLK